MKSSKHTLIATIGTSPQVVTETLYAIHQNNEQWPDEIFLITTTVGKGKAVKGLLDDGHLQRLCQQLQRPQPAFDAAHVLVVPGADGSEVEDARSLADHEALANFIMTEVRDRTSGTHGSVHASLAGGRKTMTFYIGYAMSLFGRPQDRLSHVLVSEGFENVPGFWFPTSDAAHRQVDNRGTPLDAAAAEVTLAPIPFVRHRHDLPRVLLQTGERVDFAQLVQLINLGENPDTLRLQVDLNARCIRVLDSASDICVTITPTLLNLAFYAMLARATMQGETDFLRPSKSRPDRGMARELVDELLVICRRRPGGSLERDLEVLGDIDQLRGSTLDLLARGITDTWFDQRRNELGVRLEEKLPVSLTRWLTPRPVWAKDGTRLPLEPDDKTPKGCGYGIALRPEQIALLEHRSA